MPKKITATLLDSLMLHKWPYWLSAFTVGIVAVFYAKLVFYAEQLATHIANIDNYYLLILSPICFAGSWALVHFFAPEAKGSGIPQVMVAVDEIKKEHSQHKIESLLGFKVMVVKILSSLLCLVGGGAIGREGPTLQISASLFYLASKKIKIFKDYITSDVWIITGAAAGLAAAFNTPLGGLVYAIEELATQHFNRFKTSLIAAVIIAGFSSQTISGSYLYLGYPKITSFSAMDIPYVAIVAVICGLAGALFGQVLIFLSRKKNLYFKSSKSLFFFSLCCGFLFASCAIFIDHSFLGSGKEQLMTLLFSDNEVHWYETLIRFFSPILTYLAGGAGGIFAPSLAAGGTIGEFLGQLFHTDYSNLFVLLGMIAFLSGVTRAPFTAFILVLEMTDRHSAILPMMLVAVLASTIARAIHPKSVYEQLKEMYV